MNTKEKVLTHKIVFVATPEDHENLKDLAYMNRVSMGEMLRRMIKDNTQEMQYKQHNERQLNLI